MGLIPLGSSSGFLRRVEHSRGDGIHPDSGGTPLGLFVVILGILLTLGWNRRGSPRVITCAHFWKGRSKWWDPIPRGSLIETFAEERSLYVGIHPPEWWHPFGLSWFHF